MRYEVKIRSTDLVHVPGLFAAIQHMHQHGFEARALPLLRELFSDLLTDIALKQVLNSEIQPIWDTEDLNEGSLTFVMDETEVNKDKLKNRTL